MKNVSRDILDRCRNGDAEAFSEVVQTYERPLFSYVYRFTAGECGLPDSEDIVQEVFLKVWRGLPRWNPVPPRSFEAWLFTIARNHLVELLRRPRPQLVHNTGDRDDILGRIVDEQRPSPRDNASFRELEASLATAVAALPEALRTVFLLRFHEDLSYLEIAECMDCEVGTVKSRLSRARAFLTTELREKTTTRRKGMGS